MAKIFSKTTPATGAIAVFTLKTLMKAAGWTVPASSDGTTYNATGDQITSGASGAGGLNNTNAWFRIRSPDGVQEFCIQRTTAASAYRVKWSPSAKFVSAPIGGGSTDATHTPSASDESSNPLLGSGSDASPTGAAWFSTDNSYRFLCMADNAAPYGVWSGAYQTSGGAPSHKFMLDPVSVADATDANKYVASACGTTTPWSVGGPTLDTNQSATCRTFACAPTAGTPASAVPCAACILVTEATAVPNNVGTSPLSGKDERIPVMYARRAGLGGTPFFKGTSTLWRWTGSSRATSDVQTVNTAKDRIIIGDCSLEWDGSDPP